MRKTVIGIVAGLMIGATTVAVAAIPDSNGLITGCRNVKSGALRVIDAEAGRTCSKDEAALTWNQAGPAGPQGPAGPAGPEGPQGPAGQSGMTGYELIMRTETVVVDAGQTTYGTFIDVCASHNKMPLGGGGYLSLESTSETPNPAPGWSVGASRPFRNAEGSHIAWLLMLVRPPGGPAATYTLHTSVTCATP